jgi:hypothetical protein
MSEEIDLLELPREEWHEMLRAAAELDLVHGGYFRIRTTGVLFYCDPDDAPPGWSGPYNDGSPGMPRALVGEAEVHGQSGTNAVVVRLLVSNWSAMRVVKDAYERGDFRGRYTEFLVAQESAFRGRPEDREWLRIQFQKLRVHAAGSLIGR